MLLFVALLYCWCCATVAVLLLLLLCYCCCCTYCGCFRGSAASFSSLSDAFQLALHGIGTTVDSSSLNQLYTTTPHHFHPCWVPPLATPPCKYEYTRVTPVDQFMSYTLTQILSLTPTPTLSGAGGRQGWSKGQPRPTKKQWG